MSVRQVRSFIVFCLLFALLGISTQVFAGFFYGKQKFYTVKTEHFYIHYPEGLGPIAEEMKIIAEESYQNVSGRLEWKTWGRTHVVLTDKTDQANGLATVFPYNYILLYTALPTADSSLDHYKDYMRLLFEHEYTHVIHIDQNYRWARPVRTVLGKIVAPNGATPGWMREGMAVYEESVLAPGFGRNNSSYTEMIIRTSILENKFPRIDQVAGLTRHFPGGTGPYLYGGKFFEWLAATYGEDRMYKYQKLYASGLWVFSLNNKARRVYGKSFYKLWKEFEAHLTQKYELERQKIAAGGLTSFDTIVRNKDSQDYFTPHPNGSGYAYYEESFDKDNQIVIKLDESAQPTVLKRKLFGQMSFSKTGRYLAFSSLGGVEPKTAWSEVYYYDTQDKKLFRVKDDAHAQKSMRARDPAFSSADGGQRWLVMVRNYLTGDQLYVFDLYEKRGYVITDAPEKTQFSNPRFSPDGNKIVVSQKDPKTGYRDIVVYSRGGKKLYQVTNGIEPANNPVFSTNGSKIYFDWYKSGVPNIYEHHVASRRTRQISNVIDGVFQPMQIGNSSYIAVKRYTTGKTYIQKFDTQQNLRRYSQATGKDVARQNPVVMGGQSDGIHPKYSLVNTSEMTDVIPQGEIVKKHVDYGPIKNRHPKSVKSALYQFGSQPDSPELLPDDFYGGHGDDKDGKKNQSKDQSQTATPKVYPSKYRFSLKDKEPEFDVPTDNPPDAKKYSAFPQLLVPRYVLPSVLFFENAVLAGLAIGRNDPLFRHSWTAFVNYRSDAKFAGGGATYIYSRYKPIFYVGGLRYVVDWGDVNATRFYEQRHQAYAGFSYSLKRHLFSGAYFYEDRSAFTDLNVNLLNMKPYAGFRFKYQTSKYKQYVNSISPENGYKIKIASEWTNQYFGSHDVNEEITIRGDARYYFEMPWSDHHVLALRVAGGTVWGDIQQFGVYRLGGPFGEGVGANFSSRLFPLRGLAGITYGGDRVFIFSGEYRWPLITNANRGLFGTWPFFLDKLHLNFFVDGGDIKFRSEESDLFTRMLVSVGTELVGSFVIGYGLPINFRAGYGLILTNRGRLGNLKDATTRQSLRYGSVYFQFGTMF